MSEQTNRWQLHIDILSKELGCEVKQSEQSGIPHGMMYVEFGYIEGPIIHSQSDYLVLLHELGHFAYGHTQGRPPHQDKVFYFDNGVLKSEAQAWEWALDRNLDSLEELTRNFMWYCLGTYLSSAKLVNGKSTRLTNGDRGYVEFVFDQPDNYFWSIVSRMRGIECLN